MNTKKLSLKLYVALSLLNLVMMGLVGCGTLEVSAVEAKAVDPNPVDAEAVEVESNEIGMESESGSVDQTPMDQLPSESETSPILSDEEAIRAALAAFHGMDESEFFHFEVKQNTGSHARGGVDNG